MPRSFQLPFLFVATILAGLAVEVATVGLVVAGEPEPFELPQWEPFEMTVKPDTCMAQYDGLTATSKMEGWFFPTGLAAADARQRVCSQYTRNKGWVLPKHGSCQGGGRDGYGDLHYYCYCYDEAVVECVEEGETDQTPARSRKPKSSLASAFDKATELVEAVGRAIYYARAHPDALSRVRFDGSSRSGTRYRTSSDDADTLYAKGMRAYAKASHTDAETLEALTSFSACIEEDPTHVPCLWELGWVLWVNGHYGQTKILWDRVKQIDPNHEQVDAELRRLESKL